MLLATSTEEALKNQRQVHVNGSDYTLSEYVGAMPLRGHYQEGNEVNDNGLPQGFLVYQPPGSVTPPHFHDTNQFQVFVDGSGTLGRLPAKPLTVQYAGGHTVYGPIAAGEDGVRYFTLRQFWDPGAKYMPGARARLRKELKRTRIADHRTAAGEAERMARGEVAIETLIAPEADGLCGTLHRLGPNMATEAPDPSEGGGQYLIVASGSLTYEGLEMTKWSTLFATPDEPAPTLRAGPTGLDLLVLRFPRG